MLVEQLTKINTGPWSLMPSTPFCVEKYKTGGREMSPAPLRTHIAHFETVVFLQIESRVPIFKEDLCFLIAQDAMRASST
jgi:hypothetical protein